MTKSEDIVNLFQQFGGQVDDYQELSRQQSAAQAKKRWPLLSALELGQATAATAPGVAAAEAPVTAGPIECRPAPIAPPVQVLAPSGQHLSSAELALGTPAPVPAPAPAPVAAAVPAQPPTPALATFAPAPAAAAVAAVPTPTPAPAAPPSVQAPTPMHWPAPTATEAAASPAVSAAWAPAVPAAPVRAPEPPLQAGLAPVFSQPTVPAAVQAPLPAPRALTSTSPLASLAQTIQAAPTPAAPVPPSTELQGIFDRLAGRAEVAPPPPPPSGLAALWQNLRGGA